MSSVISRFRAAIELREVMISMHRQRLIREHPEESRGQIERRVKEWVTHQEPPRLRSVEPSP